jgi:hypothetical protein
MSGKIAQTFTIPNTTATGLPGVFITQIGVYFAAKHDTLGVTCYICETVNGYPDSLKMLTKAYLSSSSVTTSNDSSSETIFVLEDPIFCTSGATYSFIIEPEANNPNYRLWISSVGQTDIVTGKSITANPYAGSMFYSNDIAWTISDTNDVKFKLYRARFNSLQGTAVFRNKKRDYFTVTGLTKANNYVSISVGDVVYSANSSNTAQFLTSNLSVYPFGTVSYVDEAANTIYVDNTNGLFSNTTYKNIRIFRPSDSTNTSLIASNTLIANATIYTVDNISYHGIIPKFTTTSPTYTMMRFGYYGTSNSTTSYTKDDSSISPNMEQLYEFRDYERVIRSYSNEVAANTYTNGTSTFKMDLNTNNWYLSPAARLDTKVINLIRNDINNDTTNEQYRYGNSKSKYVSKVITLNQVAEDLQVYITGYRPYGSDIVVWGKFINSESDVDLFDNKLWTQLTNTNETSGLYSSPKDLTDFKEYKFGIANTAAYSQSSYADPIGNTALGVAIGTLTYTDGKGVVHRGFNQFAIKVDLVSDNPVLYPMMRDIRAIALQV